VNEFLLTISFPVPFLWINGRKVGTGISNEYGYKELDLPLVKVTRSLEFVYVLVKISFAKNLFFLSWSPFIAMCYFYLQVGVCGMRECTYPTSSSVKHTYTYKLHAERRRHVRNSGSHWLVRISNAH
jgi:hypothetical protein